MVNDFRLDDDINSLISFDGGGYKKRCASRLKDGCLKYFLVVRGNNMALVKYCKPCQRKIYHRVEV